MNAFLVPVNERQREKNEQKMKFSTEDFFSKCDQIRRKLRIWSHLLKKSFMENFVFVQCLTMASIQHAKQYLNLHRTNVVVMFIEVA